MRASAERVGVAALSHTGCLRENNEDAFLVDPALGLYVVCDGMGGHECGEIASRLAVEEIHTCLSRPGALDGDRADLKPERSALGRAIVAAHERVCQESASRELPVHMGTTVVTALVRDGSALVANVGDSRAYLVSPRGGLKLSRDHTLARFYAESGLIGDADVEQHPLRGVLVRCLGAPDGCLPDFHRISLAPGDRLLLCSDGLTDMVAESELVDIVREGPDPDSISRRLVEAALAAGGEDNVTVLVVEQGAAA